MKVKLKDIGTIITGNTPSKKEKSYWDSKDICFVKPDIISETGISLIEDSNEYISEAARSKARIVSKDAIFITCIGSIGKIGIACEGDYAFNQQINAIVPNDKVDSKYLAYALLNSKSRLEAIANAPVVPIINKSQFGDFSINIEEDRSVQLDIVLTLDTLSKIIKKRIEELKILDDLIKARFIEMFGDPETNPKSWEQVTLNDVCSSIVRGPFGSALKKEFFVEPDETTYKVYEQKHAIQKSSTIGTYYVTAEKYNELKRFECCAGDILMSCSGTMGELYQLPEGCERGIINQALCKFTLNERILPIFFLVYMQQTIGDLETKGSGIKNIAAVSYVKAMPINLPPMKVQKLFATFVTQVDKSKCDALNITSAPHYLLAS